MEKEIQFQEKNVMNVNGDYKAVPIADRGSIYDVEHWRNDLNVEVIGIKYTHRDKDQLLKFIVGNCDDGFWHYEFINPFGFGYVFQKAYTLEKGEIDKFDINQLNLVNKILSVLGHNGFNCPAAEKWALNQEDYL